jgi:hypothetical protein
MEQIQAAIWRLMWGDSWLFDGVVQSMLADAHANGSGFTPGPGQIIVVILYADEFGVGPHSTLLSALGSRGGGEKHPLRTPSKTDLMTS